MEEMTLDECCDLVKDKFMVQNVKVFGNLGSTVKRVAISPGSGKSMVPVALEKGADVLITGDIDHHTGIDAYAQGLCIIDAGHYGLERIFIPDMKEYLENVLEGVIVKAADVYSPFLIV
jgi:putative NIF3 family GTP cyclohydrolase 1 type 2